MRRQIHLAALTLLVFCFIGGCFGLSKPEKLISYYTLEYSALEVKGLSPLPFAILVERFQVDPMYDSNKIIYRSNKFRREAYTYHRWRTNPGDMTTQLFARDFKETKLFKAVFALDSRFPSTHLLKGTIDEIYELDEEDQWKAILTISVTLIKEGEADPLKSILFQKQYSMKEVCEKKNPEAFVAAMSSAMQKISTLVIRDIHKRLS